MKKQLNNIIRYDSINGLRVLACIGIVLMHVCSNIGYKVSGRIPNLVISEFTNFVFLFMVISSFGLCCGYYNKIKNNELNMEKFYSKRIFKILPFFLFLILLDLIIEHNIPSLIEGFADSTLLFGFLQKEINVVGVAWFIGLVFIFYLMFPYFTFLFSNKKRAWLTTIVAVLMNLVCVYYFNVGRENMFYSFIYFCIGGLIYIYKDSIIKLFSKSRIIGLIFIFISIALYFIMPTKNEYLILPRILLVSASLLCYAISYKSVILDNKVTKFVGDISFEIYLCHMVIFRMLEKLHITKLFSNNWLSYITTSIIVVAGAIILSIIFKKIYLFAYNKKYSLKGEK